MCVGREEVEEEEKEEERRRVEARTNGSVSTVNLFFWCMMGRLCVTGVIHRRRDCWRHGAKTRLRHHLQLRPPQATADAFKTSERSSFCRGGQSGGSRAGSGGDSTGPDVMRADNEAADDASLDTCRWQLTRLTLAVAGGSSANAQHGPANTAHWWAGGWFLQMLFCQTYDGGNSDGQLLWIKQGLFKNTQRNLEILCSAVKAPRELTQSHSHLV